MKKNQTKEQYKEWLNKIAKEKRNNPNHSEQAFIDMLDYFDIKYTFEKPIIYNHKDGYNGYIFDFYILIDDNEFDIEIDDNEFDIEIDGISHTDEDSKLKDQKRDALAKDCNIEVIRMDSYFVLYLRNIFEDEFTKESFLKWIINGCPISFKKDMSEYKEKYEIAKAKVNTVAEEIKATSIQHNALIKQHNAIADQLDAAVKQYNKMVQAFIELQSMDDRQLEAENIMKGILAKQKEMRFKVANNSTSTSSNNSSTVETSNDKEDEELPF